MADFVHFGIGSSVQAQSGSWYRNLQVLGSGGNATAFLVVATSGEHRGLLFALKIFRQISKPERRASFLAEVQFLQACRHPAIMRVFDEGVYNQEHPFVVAEYLPETLAQVIRSRSASLTKKVAFTLQLLSALYYLDSGLGSPAIHRDIKPQNIFVKGNSCVLGDLGLMKRVMMEDAGDREFFKDSLGVGMPFRYRTPDLVDYLVNGTRPTTKSDVFQLGLVIAELFTGRNPQKPTSSFDSPVEIESLGRIQSAMARGIGSLIGRMLEVDPTRRDSASKLMDPWQGVFVDAARRSYDLDGRVFF